MEDGRQDRGGVDGTLYRDMNERSRRQVDEFDTAATHYKVMCECTIPACDDMLELGRSAYDHVRSDPAWFLVRPGHLVEERETLVDDAGDHWIVRRS